MNATDLVTSGGFLALFLLILLRVPIGVAMALVGVVGFGTVLALRRGWDRGFEIALNLLSTSPVRTVTDFNLSLIPFFILMGVFAERSGLSRELFRFGNAWLGSLRGGVAFATITSCAGFSAVCGSSIATAATMTKIALPEMRRLGYREETATGVIAAGGTLGILIPPSVVLAIYGFITETDIGKLFIAGIFPGILAVLLYIATVRIAHARGLPAGKTFDAREALASLRAIWAVVIVFLGVIVAIYMGLATPTEAAAVGAVLTMAIGIARRRLDLRTILQALTEALRTSVTIYTIIIGAVLFSQFLAQTQTPQKITASLIGLDFGAYGTLLLILLLFLIAGCILDTMAMIILMVPIVFPVVINLGFDPIWFGIVVVIVAELGLITPPFGINVFVINSIARDARLLTIYRGVLPFIVTDIIRLAIVVAFPSLVLWLPQTMR